MGFNNKFLFLNLKASPTQHSAHWVSSEMAYGSSNFSSCSFMNCETHKIGFIDYSFGNVLTYLFFLFPNITIIFIKIVIIPINHHSRYLSHSSSTLSLVADSHSFSPEFSLLPSLRSTSSELSTLKEGIVKLVPHRSFYPSTHSIL